MKAGRKSSEFYVTLGAAIVVILMMTGVLPDDFDQSKFMTEYGKIVSALLVIVPAIFYTKKRTELKEKNGNNVPK